MPVWTCAEINLQTMKNGKSSQASCRQHRDVLSLNDELRIETRANRYEWISHIEIRSHFYRRSRCDVISLKLKERLRWDGTPMDILTSLKLQMHAGIGTNSYSLCWNHPSTQSNHRHSVSQRCNTHSCIFSRSQSLDRALESTGMWLDAILACCSNIIVAMPVVWLVTIFRTHDAVW